MMMTNIEERARKAYIANAHFVNDNVDNIHIDLCRAFAKEQDRLHKLIQHEEDLRMQRMIDEN